ncbi:hypothetical protein NQ095_12915 [Rossellomorea sp. SC111]|uniref:hypothetical protein n=1 Tax=Rossellomorea sp. SC111 TaxID=2968985 RepID=UPI00215AD9FC|nr:hypothetical protein [Rossellomorea sp. SC111]MCR8849315.1 hypothetical protein [Rossellomorea sp. SC111]
MFKSEKVNRILAIVMYWGMAVFVVSGNQEFLNNPFLFSLIAILTCSFTAFQTVKIRKIER